MKKNITILLTILLLLFSFTSCRQDITKVPPTEEVTTYAELFTAWWDKMNKYYVFWDLDSPGREWDEVYDEYYPLFEECGEIEGSDPETQAKVIDYFYDITLPLSDSHYYMELNLPGMDSIRFAPSKVRAYLRAGLTPEEAKDAALNNRGSEYEKYVNSAFRNENTLNILKNVFGINTSVSGEPVYKPFSEDTVREGKLSDYFTQAGYFITPEDYDYAVDGEPLTVDSFAVFAGITEDKIGYFAFSDFTFSPFIYNAIHHEEPVGSDLMELCNSFFDSVTETDALDGVIIDLRGNGGGRVSDLNLLWSSFISEDVKIAEIRGKKIDNRQSYSSWQDLAIQANESAERNFDKPVAVLVNGHTASCAEMSTLFFMALRDNHGGNAYVIGDTTIGAQGPLEDGDPSDKYGSGSFHVYSPVVVDPDEYIIFNNTPIYESRGYDGINREGVGIEPDAPSVAFNVQEFNSGTDARLNRAFEWVRTGN